MITDQQLQNFYINQYPVQKDHTELNVKLWEHIEALIPESVFEFGCNCGKNLMNLQKRMEGLSVGGCDINQRAIDNALVDGLHVGGVSHLSMVSHMHQQRGLQVDIGLTCSVLCHMNEVDSVIESLKSMCKTVILLETNDKRDWNYIPHNYEDRGFIPVWSHKQLGGNQCLYTCYQWNK